MSRMWKFAIGVVAIVVVIVAGLAWFALSRGWVPGAFAQRAGQTTQLEVKLIDDNEDGIPDRGVIDLPEFGRSLGPGRDDRFGQRPGTEAAQFDIRLVDDDGDGIPDRGVIEHPPGPAFGRKGAFDRRFGPGRDSDFGRGFSRGFSRGFGAPLRLILRPFFIIVGGLVVLAFLALLAVLIVFLVRRGRSSSPSAPASTQSGDPS